MIKKLDSLDQEVAGSNPVFGSVYAAFVYLPVLFSQRAVDSMSRSCYRRQKFQGSILGKFCRTVNHDKIKNLAFVEKIKALR